MGKRNKLFTEEVFLSIPVWLAAGASKEDIAESLGTTVGSLEVMCSARGTSLNTRAYKNVGIPSPELNMVLRKQLKAEAWVSLCAEARRRKMSGGRLVISLLEYIINDNLFVAVLDLDDNGINDHKD